MAETSLYSLTNVTLLNQDLFMKIMEENAKNTKQSFSFVEINEAQINIMNVCTTHSDPIIT